ncbi:MAG: isoprenylcysteine carboxylmethyltransferase family protein [Burkholderiales bacterium]
MIAADSSDRERRWLPPRALLASLIAQLPLLLASWPPSPAGPALASGLVLLALGIGLNAWADRLFHRAGVGVCPYSPVPRLVAGGPFRYSRHPMYVGLVCVTAGAALASGVYANLWSAVAFALWLDGAYVRPEEAFLRAELGAEYDAYARRVPRWLGWSRAT